MTNIETKPCNECGSDDWTELDKARESYPDRRKSSSQTTKHVLICDDCGASGRIYDDGQSSGIQRTGAMRQ